MKTAADDDIPADLFDPLPVLDRSLPLSDDGYARLMLAEILLWSLEARHQGRVARNEAVPVALVLAHHPGAKTYTIACPFCGREHQEHESALGRIVPADKCSSRDVHGRKLQLPRGLSYTVALYEEPSVPGAYADDTRSGRVRPPHNL